MPRRSIALFPTHRPGLRAWRFLLCLALLFLLVALPAQGETAFSGTTDPPTTLWAWGDNYFGELGNGTFTTSSYYGIATPGKVMGLSSPVAAAAGWYFSLALQSDGTVWAWGQDYLGQLGNGESLMTGNRGIATPTQITALSDIVAVAAGVEHGMALDSSGNVWAWGDNTYGELGHIQGEKGDTYYDMDFYNDIPVPVSGVTGVIAIAAGGYFSLALKSDGTVWAWGLNEDGQLGNGTLYTGEPNFGPFGIPR